jgi:hypothetical protein
MGSMVRAAGSIGARSVPLRQRRRSERLRPAASIRTLPGGATVSRKLLEVPELTRRDRARSRRRLRQPLLAERDPFQDISLRPSGARKPSREREARGRLPLRRRALRGGDERKTISTFDAAVVEPGGLPCAARPPVSSTTNCPRCRRSLHLQQIYSKPLPLWLKPGPAAALGSSRLSVAIVSFAIMASDFLIVRLAILQRIIIIIIG